MNWGFLTIDGTGLEESVVSIKHTTIRMTLSKTYVPNHEVQNVPTKLT